MTYLCPLRLQTPTITSRESLRSSRAVRSPKIHPGLRNSFIAANRSRSGLRNRSGLRESFRITRVISIAWKLTRITGYSLNRRSVVGSRLNYSILMWKPGNIEGCNAYLRCSTSILNALSVYLTIKCISTDYIHSKSPDELKL